MLAFSDTTQDGVWGLLGEGMTIKEYVDIGFIVPLQEELERLEKYFPKLYDEVNGTVYHTHLEMGVTGLKGVAYLQDAMGKAAATRATSALLDKYDVGLVVVLGIAGGLSNDVAVGDVCVSGSIIDVLENAKLSDGKRGAVNTEFNSQFYATDSRLTFAVRYSQIGLGVKGRFESWQLERYYAAKELIPGEFIGRNDKNEVVGLPRVHDGSLVCGAVSKSAIYKSNLKTIDRKVLALETESGGVFHTAQLAGVDAIAIRGVCDYADKNKNKLEEQVGSAARTIAADNAVSFLASQFCNPQFLRFLDAVRSKRGSRSDLLLPAVDPEEQMREALAETKKLVESQLSILLPGYKPNDPNYRLPVPRVRLKQSTASVSPVIEQREPVSPLEAISSNRAISITLPRSYPDHSLPWVLAAELAEIEIDGKQAIPIVIDSESVKPPHSSLAAQSKFLTAMAVCSSARPVVILTDLPPSARSRIQAIRQEMDKYPDARFVVLNSSDHDVTDESELALTLGCHNHNVCEIPFVEVAGFFQRSLRMEDQVAGVLALKLRDMFKKFDLDAHPSYFAGVGVELIYSLLKANRRSELIELAVGGYLTFLVATDGEDVVLSRTTRESFLKRLVYEQRVMRRSFSKSQLVELVDEFADESDYDIDAIAFIKSFNEKGLIHFEDGVARISLPFVESYLLAKVLSSNETAASGYFRVEDQDFDYSTFDLYAELGPHDNVVSKVSQALSDVIDQFASDSKHILLTDEIRPRIVDRQTRLRDLQDKLQKAFDDVVQGRPNSVEKQRMLDVATRVQESARSEQERISKANREAGQATISNLNDPIRVWGIATTLLGSGSESLKKAQKRKLAELIVRSTSILIDALLRAFPRLEFDQFKDSLQTDEALREIFSISDDVGIDVDLKDFVGAVVDAYEFALLGYPLRVMLQELGNSAGQKVLEPSISSVSLADPMEDLVAKVWASEVNAAKNRDGLLRSIQALPPSPFLRFSLSSFFLARVFWNHWEKPNRLALLDAAEESLAPLGKGRLDRGKIQRLIRKPEDRGDA